MKRKIFMQSCVVATLAITMALSSTDAFGQIFRRANDGGRVVRPAVVAESLKVEVILESNSSARQEWKLGAVKGERPTRKVLEAPDVPGAPTIVSWDFGEMRRSVGDRATEFKFSFFDEDHEYSTGFTFYPREGKVQFEYNTSVGFDWDFDRESTEDHLAVTKRTFPYPRNVVGAPTKVEWTLGSLPSGKTEGTAVFRLNFRGDDYPEVKIKVRR